MKCRIVNGKKVCRKSYNPFKMWGSWVGAVIGFLVVLTGGFAPLFIVGSILSFFNLRVSTNFIVYLFFTIFGFLLGYVLTILYRRVFK